MLKKLWHKLGSNEFARLISLGIIGFIFVVGLMVAVFLTLSSDLPDIEQLKKYEPRLTTTILDRNGEVLTELFTERRLRVPLSRMPQHTIDALLATEDARFWRHWGVDVIRIFGAALHDITTFSLQQGASTVTQQLARDLYLTKRRTFGRKIKEALTAVQIERNYSKNEILEMYLTQVYFGHGAYGIASATARYFNKSVEELTLAESCLLAALLKAPSHYSPVRHPARALIRRNVVLGRVLDEGMITNQQYFAALAETLNVNANPSVDPVGIAPYFTEMIRQKLSVEGRKLGFEYLTDGLTVRTTLDSRIQQFAEIAVDSHLTNLQHEYYYRFIKRSAEELAWAFYGDSLHFSMDSLIADTARIDSFYSNRSRLQVALVAIDVKTGDVLALIGGRDFTKSKFNRAVQAIRQPGSVFKPVVYTTAIDNGYPTTFELLNQDVVLNMSDSTRWVPQNYDRSHGGMTTLREGLRRSLNLVTVRLVQEVVPPRLVVKYARQLGYTTPIAAVDAIALGSSGVIPIEAVSSFSVFGNGGIYNEPRILTAIDDRYEERIMEYSSTHRVALSAQTAYIMTDLLRTVIDRGTGGGARWKYHFYKTAAGKTGTTNNFTDAWFIGYTPNLACGVWVGLDDPSETLGAGWSGAVVALPIWARFMKMTYDSLETDLGWEGAKFEMPAGVVKLTVCAENKLIATPYCPQKLNEIFRQDARPLRECTIHRRIGG